LVAIGFGGNKLIKKHTDNWREKLCCLANVNWRKDNPVWKNLVFVNGKVAANRSSQTALSNYLKNIMMEETGV
jgi:DNA sulfur modification protein DndB